MTLPRPTSLEMRASIDLYVEVERPVETPAPAVFLPMISPYPRFWILAYVIAASLMVMFERVPPTEPPTGMVVVPIQVGVPALIARMYPAVPALMEPSVFVPVKYGMAFAAPVYREEVAIERDCVTLLRVVREPERPRPRVAEVVAIPYTPAAPFETRRLEDEG